MTIETAKVREFMAAFGQRTPLHPEMPDGETQRLRWLLISEEAKELADATNLTEYLDAVADLLYVVLGAGVAAGFTAELMEDAVKEVHVSNMTKFWLEDEVATAPAKWSATKIGNGSFVVRDATGKIRKSPSYRPANLKPLLPTK
jgi:predicted HAD superfamily Cof-like phosphohydrolase